MRRRDFIVGLGSGVAWPAAAQQPSMPVVGYLDAKSPDGGTAPGQVAAFRKGLSEAGYVEGRNVTIEFRWANNDARRLPELAADLVRQRVTVIAVPVSTTTALVAKAARPAAKSRAVCRVPRSPSEPRECEYRDYRGTRRGVDHSHRGRSPQS